MHTQPRPRPLSLPASFPYHARETHPAMSGSGSPTATDHTYEKQRKEARMLAQGYNPDPHEMVTLDELRLQTTNILTHPLPPIPTTRDKKGFQPSELQLEALKESGWTFDEGTRTWDWRPVSTKKGLTLEAPSESSSQPDAEADLQPQLLDSSNVRNPTGSYGIIKGWSWTIESGKCMWTPVHEDTDEIQPDPHVDSILPTTSDPPQPRTSTPTLSLNVYPPAAVYQEGGKWVWTPMARGDTEHVDESTQTDAEDVNETCQPMNSCPPTMGLRIPSAMYQANSLNPVFTHNSIKWTIDKPLATTEIIAAAGDLGCQYQWLESPVYPTATRVLIRFDHTPILSNWMNRWGYIFVDRFGPEEIKVIDVLRAIEGYFAFPVSDMECEGLTPVELSCMLLTRFKRENEKPGKPLRMDVLEGFMDVVGINFVAACGGVVELALILRLSEPWRVWPWVQN